jgi:pyrroloquinoline-quinone synthase
VSAAIGQAVVARGWVAAGALVHYALHAELDVRHADEFFAIVEPRWDDAARRASIRQGLELGAYAFDQVYRAMLTAAPLASPPRSAR